MKIKNRLLTALIAVSVLAVLINTALTGLMTLRYFQDYLSENYESERLELTEYLSETLAGGEYSVQQMTNELKIHLNEPIIAIAVYDAQGNLIASVASEQTVGMNGMHGMYARRIQDTEQYEITDGTDLIGYLSVTRYGAVAYSAIVWEFRSALLRNGLISLGVVGGVTLIFGLLLSRGMSRDLTRTAELARSIEMGEADRPLRMSKAKEIRIIQQSLKSLQSRLKLKQTARKSLADELIHQSRTPLTILQSHLEAMEDGVIDMTPEEIRICNEQIQALTRIISNIDGLIDSEIAPEQIKPEPIDLAKLIEQVVAGLKISFERKSIHLELDCPNEPITVVTDRYLLSQAIYNLLTNACKYTPEGGQVILRCGKTQNRAILRLEDNGIGVPKQDVEFLFDAYRRASNVRSHDMPDGEGLGLYIAKNNLTQLGGTIRYEANHPRGSMFIAEIPLNRS